MMSPATTPVGLLIVIDALVLVLVVAEPLCAICPNIVTLANSKNADSVILL